MKKGIKTCISIVAVVLIIISGIVGSKIIEKKNTTEGYISFTYDSTFKEFKIIKDNGEVISNMSMDIDYVIYHYEDKQIRVDRKMLNSDLGWLETLSKKSQIRVKVKNIDKRFDRISLDLYFDKKYNTIFDENKSKITIEDKYYDKGKYYVTFNMANELSNNVVLAVSNNESNSNRITGISPYIVTDNKYMRVYDEMKFLNKEDISKGLTLYEVKNNKVTIVCDSEYMLDNTIRILEDSDFWNKIYIEQLSLQK